VRTVTYGGAVSLDGFLAGPDGALDWLHFSPDVQQVMAGYWAGVDAVLMGRKTWEAAAAQAPPRPKRRAPASRAGARKAEAVRTYVFSRTLGPIDDPAVELVRGDAGAFVAGLKTRPGGGICLMGGGELAQSLLAAGVVDEIGLNVHPVLLGAGIPVFRDPGRRVRLALKDTRPIAGGCVLVTYTVVRD